MAEIGATTMYRKAISVVVAAVLALHGCSVASQTAPEIGVFDLESQRISGVETITAAGPTAFGSVNVLVTVDVDGHVSDAKVTQNHFGGDAGAALAAARTWKFHPQHFDGKPIRAIGEIEIALKAPEIPPDLSVAFPDAPAGDYEVTLERYGCFGSCPSYRVSISGDGKVRFSAGDDMPPASGGDEPDLLSRGYVLWAGTHEARVAPQAVAALIKRFRAAHFMGLKPEYEAQITDNPTYVLTLRAGTTSKRVIDYVGEAVGMPADVTALENAVDKLAGTDRWVRGNAETVALLKAKGFNFKSTEAARLAQAAIWLSPARTDATDANAFIKAMIAAGLDLSAPVRVSDFGRSKRTTTIGSLIVRHAAESGDEGLFDDMAQRGEVARMRKEDRNGAFRSGSGCNPRIAKALVAAGADPRTRDDNGNALHAVREPYGRCADAGSDRRVEMAATLIALGVPLEARDDLGWTPLMGCDDPAVAQLLLKAGANANARNDEGTTPVLSVDDDRVVLLLLRAGANPNVKDSDGTLRQQAVKRHWPGTLAWLDDHGIK